MVVFVETESRMVVGSGWREGGIGSCLIGREFVFQDKKNSGHWLHNSVNVPNGHRIVCLRMVNVVNFMYVLPQF